MVPGVATLVLKRIDLSNAERLFYPTVPVLVTVEYNGRIGGMLAAWWCQVSFKPLLVAVAIAPERYTYKLIKKSGVFALNLLDYSLVDKTPFLGDVSERFFKDKIREAGLTIMRGEVLGAPIVTEAAAAIEARLYKIVEAGDHDLFIGEVVAAYAIEDFENGMWRLKKYRPLMYLGRTRRPGPVYRVYVAAKEFEKRELEFAAGRLKEYAERRRMVLNEVYRAADEARTEDELRQVIAEIVSKYGLEADDVEYYFEEARRRMKTKR